MCMYFWNASNMCLTLYSFHAALEGIQTSLLTNVMYSAVNGLQNMGQTVSHLYGVVGMQYSFSINCTNWIYVTLLCNTCRWLRGSLFPGSANSQRDAVCI